MDLSAGCKMFIKVYAFTIAFFGQQARNCIASAKSVADYFFNWSVKIKLQQNIAPI